MRSRCLCCLALSIPLSLYLTGCGAQPNCDVITLTVLPATATLNHTVAGNAQAFEENVSVPKGCPLPPLPAPIWTVSNTTAASITTSGVASCKAAAAAPITVSSG